MVAGLAFLSKKRFNPANTANQKTVWEAQQQKEIEIRRAKERADQLRRERDDEELARARGGARGGDQATLRFMYAPPPGLEAPTSNEEPNGHGNDEPNHSTSPNNVNYSHPGPLTQRQPGDDDAAAAFRKMLEAAANENVGTNNVNDDGSLKTSKCQDGTVSSMSGAALSGTSIENKIVVKHGEHLTALEKAVGRKDAAAGLSLEEQIARFPQLKNAPMAKGMNGTNVNVTFKPLGTQLRNVRCLACGVWGHSRGDRECARSGWNPFAGTLSTAATTTISLHPQEIVKVKDNEQEKETQRHRRKSDDADDSSSDSDDSNAQRKRKRKHSRSHKSSRHRHESSSRRTRRSRSSSSDERHKSRTKSSKRHKKLSRHD